jgi:hypothetical protein
MARLSALVLQFRPRFAVKLDFADAALFASVAAERLEESAVNAALALHCFLLKISDMQYLCH